MAIVDGEGIGYVGDVGTWSRYLVMIGNRAVLELSVDNADPELKIWVGRPGSRQALLSGSEIEQTMVGLPIETKGRAKRGPHEVGGSDTSPGDLKDHIDGMTVYSYVLPRLFRFMADIYVPKSEIDG
jgi:hypothetical protein